MELDLGLTDDICKGIGGRKTGYLDTYGHNPRGSHPIAQDAPARSCVDAESIVVEDDSQCDAPDQY